MAQALHRPPTVGAHRLGAIVLVLIILSAVSGFYIDLLWFREVDFADVFWRVFWSKVLLGLIFGSCSSSCCW